LKVIDFVDLISGADGNYEIMRSMALLMVVDVLSCDGWAL